MEQPSSPTTLLTEGKPEVQRGVDCSYFAHDKTEAQKLKLGRAQVPPCWGREDRSPVSRTKAPSGPVSSSLPGEKTFLPSMVGQKETGLGV